MLTGALLALTGKTRWTTPSSRVRKRDLRERERKEQREVLRQDWADYVEHVRSDYVELGEIFGEMRADGFGPLSGGLLCCVREEIREHTTSAGTWVVVVGSIAALDAPNAVSYYVSSVLSTPLP